MIAEKTTNSLPYNEAGELIQGIGVNIYQFAYYEYNNFGQLKETTQWDNQRKIWLPPETNEYDNESGGDNVFGNIVETTDAEGHVTQYTYNSNGYMTSRTEAAVYDADGATTDIVTAYKYRGKTGWLKWIKNPRDYVTEYEYDRLGRVTEIIEPDDNDDSAYNPEEDSPRTGNPVTTITYGDTAGNLYAEETDSMGSKTKYKFDDFGQLKEINKFRQLRIIRSYPAYLQPVGRHRVHYRPQREQNQLYLQRPWPPGKDYLHRRYTGRHCRQPGKAYGV